VSGVEGYVESAASGILAGINARRLLAGLDAVAPPPESALGALCRYISEADPENYQPTNIAFGLLPPLAETPGVRRPGKARRREQIVARALAALDAWIAEHGEHADLRGADDPRRYRESSAGNR